MWSHKHSLRLVAFAIAILLTSTMLPSIQSVVSPTPFGEVALAADAVATPYVATIAGSPSTSAPIRLSALADPPYSVTIRTTLSPAFIDAGQPITISYILMPNNVSPQWPTGLVTIYDINGEPICESAQSTGSCSFTPTARGSITIDYSGDSYFAPNQLHIALPIRVQTWLAMDALPHSVSTAQVITLTTGISSDGVACAAAFFCAPTGQVQYTDNGHIIGIAGVHPRVGAVFPITVTLPIAGIHHIAGFYSGDSRYMPSASAPLTIESIPLNGYLPLIVKP